MDFDFLISFVIKYWYLWLSLIVLLGLLIYHELRGAVHGVRLLTAAQVVEKINREQAVIVDIRPSSIYAEGHIVDAQSIPESDLSVKQGKLAKYKQRPIVVACQSGQQCTKVGAQFVQEGFDQVFALKGGMNAWNEAGLPLVKRQAGSKKKLKSK